MSEDTDRAETEALKEKVFAGMVRWFAVGGVLVALILVAQAAYTPALLPAMISPIVVIAAFPIFLLVYHWLGYPRAAVAFLVYLWGGATYFQCERGVTPGAALVTVTFLVLSGLYFGGRGGRWASLAALVSLCASAFVSTRPGAGPWVQEWFDPHEGIVWLRFGAVLAFFGGGIVWAFTQLSQGLAAQRAKLRATLEREAEERARHERTQEALEQAERLSTLAQFAGGLAHDFNNSLMVIMSAASMIEDDSSDPRARDLAREITRGADVSAAMVRQLLTLGRPSRAEVTRIGVDALFQQCRSTLRSVLPVGIDLNLAVGAESETEIAVDPAGIQHALLNLALNARDAMPNHGTLTLSAYRRTVREPPRESRVRPGTFTVIACQDTGSGMDESTQQRVFEPFFTTKAAGKGTGLGLAMVQRVVSEAGGFVSLESALGTGTTFHLHFPLLDGAQASQHTPTNGGVPRSAQVN